MPYSEYLKTQHWQNIKERQRIFACGCCQACNAKNTDFDVHHRSYDCLWREKISDVNFWGEDCHEINHPKLVLKNGKETKYLGSWLLSELFRVIDDVKLKQSTTKLFVEGLRSRNKFMRDCVRTHCLKFLLTSIASKKGYLLIKKNETP